MLMIFFCFKPTVIKSEISRHYYLLNSTIVYKCKLVFPMWLFVYFIYLFSPQTLFYSLRLLLYFVYLDLLVNIFL